MATGRCTNIMRCSKAKNKEIQEADKANFVCAECGKPLMEVTGQPAQKEEYKKPGTSAGRTPKGVTTSVGNGRGKLYGLIAVVVLVLLGGGAYMAFGGGDDVKKVRDKKALGTDSVQVAVTVTIVPPTTTTLKVGGVLPLSAKVNPAGNSVAWSSSDETVASVSSNGEVKALKAGGVNITAQSGTAQATIKIDVHDIEREPPVKTVFGGRATYDKASGVIRFKSSVTISLHDEDDNTITLRPGDEIRGAKVSGGRLVGGEAVVGGESQLLTGINERL